MVLCPEQKSYIFLNISLLAIPTNQQKMNKPTLSLQWIAKLYINFINFAPSSNCFVINGLYRFLGFLTFASLKLFFFFLRENKLLRFIDNKYFAGTNYQKFCQKSRQFLLSLKCCLSLSNIYWVSKTFE